MTDPILASTLVLTLLLLIGLIFFVKASVKDRTQAWVLTSDLAGEQLVQQLRQYFNRRAYQVIAVQPMAGSRSQDQSDLEHSDLEHKDLANKNPTPGSNLWNQPGTVTLVGQVRPSIFLAFFLSALVASGLFCLGLVLTILLPQIGSSGPALALLGPLAGGFYWQGAGRPEQVSLRVEAQTDRPDHSQVLIQGHRDELSDLQRELGLQRTD